MEAIILLSWLIKGKGDIVGRRSCLGDLGCVVRDDDILLVEEGELVELEFGSGLLWGAEEGATEIVAGIRYIGRGK